MSASLRAHFDALVDANPDPWGTRSRWYERRKRALTLAMLPQERYRRGFEPGCSVGTLTTELQARCDELVATDASAPAIAEARRRVGEAPHVRLARAHVPEDWPRGVFDLIVVSELGYYLDDRALARFADACARSLDDDGTLLACHWRHGAGDMLQPAQAVHDMLAKVVVDGHLAHYEDADVLIDVWCADRRSVAVREGLA